MMSKTLTYMITADKVHFYGPYKDFKEAEAAAKKLFKFGQRYSTIPLHYA